MVIKTATYSGMNLKGEVRESISLDEDDISDVEDEVFIRDGKNGYKLAEEFNVKRPLMAPRRRSGKHNESRLKPKATYRAWCKPCCYVLASLSVLIGLIVLVVVLVSIYPLPLDKLRDWIISSPKSNKNVNSPLPCTSLKVTDIWSINLPALITDSPVRTIDINNDGIDDLLFGFGTGENYNILPPDIFCPIFLDVSAPCEGGVIALNGVNGSVLWRHWLNDTIFSLLCLADVNLDGLDDCLAVGVEGTISIINSQNGNEIWKLNTGKMNVFVANFIEDLNGDNISDVIASHSSLEDNTHGHIMVFSGKTGHELKRYKTPYAVKSFFMPQILKQDSLNTLVLFGTGSPNTPGNLSVISIDQLDFLTNTSKEIYQDKFQGMLTQPIFVDITGDHIPDIISSMYNSTIVAINGKTFEQIWKYTISDAITDMSPTPALFNCDNVTDFLVIYQKHDNIFNSNYTQSLIIDGFTGQPVYQPITGGVITQMNGLTLSMEGKGHDFFVFWTSECLNTNIRSFSTDKPIKNADLKIHDDCIRLYNSSTILKLNALNEYHQPPGIVLYNSAFKTSIEFNGFKTGITKLKEYLKNHQIPTPVYVPSGISDRGQSEIPKSYSGDPIPIGIRKYGKSNFRHKDRPSGIVKEFDGPHENENSNNVNGPQITITDQDPRITDQTSMDYNIWMPNFSGQDDLDNDFSNYNDDTIPYNQKQLIFDEMGSKSSPGNRDPRSKNKKKSVGKSNDGVNTKSKKKNLSDKIYDYHNVRLAKNRLLRDDESLPTDILKDTYFKNEENRLKKAKFEQRDINSHLVGEMDDSDVKKIIAEEKRNFILNGSTTLWDLESEKEIREKQERSLRRKKRNNIADNFQKVISKVTSVGAVLSPFNVSNSSNSIDLVFVKYWKSLEESVEDLKKMYIQECISNKTSSDKKESRTKQSSSLYQKECEEDYDNLKKQFMFFDQLAQLRMGQMTVYRIRITCECDSSYDKNIKERCARFLPSDLQGWSQYLGKSGNGDFTIS